ncbi:MAG: HU family DNA-binding protein [Prevotella sp.]
MNKQELISEMAANAGLSQTDSKKGLDATIKAISNALKNGDKISLIGFGTFSIKEKAERQGINPATKQKITIAAKKVVNFKAGSDLKF